MNRFIWRLIFCVICFDVMPMRLCRKHFGRVIDESRYRYKSYLNASDMAYRLLAEINK